MPANFKASGFTAWAAAELAPVRAKNCVVFDFLAESTYDFYSNQLMSGAKKLSFKEEKKQLTAHLKSSIKELKERDNKGYSSILGSLGCIVVSSIIRALVTWSVLKWLEPDEYEASYWNDLKSYRVMQCQSTH